MLARLQQAITCGLLLVALAWAAWAWSSNHAGWALFGAIAIVMSYAAVLALEFALLRRARDASESAPYPGRAQLLMAWIGEVASAPRVFCWRQPFRSGLHPDHLPVAAAGRRGLLLVHGFVCNRGLWNPWMANLRAANVPYVAVNLEPVFGSIDDYVSIIEEAVQRLERATGLPPVLVGHSMGGLAIRRWWAEQRDDNRVHHAVTIATPHHGTWLARFALSRNSRQMRLRSAWLRALEQREPAGRTTRFTCFYGHCDNIVFPPSTATLAGADNRHLAGVAHVHMAYRAEPYEEALRQLAPHAAT